MLANVFTKTVREHTLGMLIGAFALGIGLILAMASYRDVDVSLYQEFLPAAVLEMMGIPEDGGAAGLAYGAIYDMVAAFVLAGFAISMGAAAVAGEEQEGTMGLLLANPLSRRSVAASKTASMIIVIGFGVLILWGFGVVSPLWLELDTTGLELPAITFALFVNSLVYGLCALAIGSWTGKRGAATGASAGLMITGWLAASIFPFIEGWEWVGRLFPWNYYSASQPLINGIDWGDVSVLAALVVIFFFIARVGVARRDLNEKSVGVTLADRLRQNSRTQKIMEKIAGSARVSRISVKTASEFQGLVVVTAGVMFLLSLMMGPIYALVPDDLKDFFSDFPDALIAMIGGVDMGTATGFLQAEIFSITGPVVMIILTTVMGSRALAGEEERHTMGLLLGNPVSRSHVVVEKVIAMVVYALLLGVVTFLGTWLGVLLGGVDVAVAGIGAASAQLSLLGLVFGGVALAIGAATGRSRLASATTAGVAVAGYFMWSFFPVSESFQDWVVVSPFHFFLGSDPLVNGMVWGDAAVLVGAFLVLVALSIPLFYRRDLRG
jgi:ABC-2 type transport system permease protein